MNTRRTTLLIALILALGTGWLALSYFSNLQRTSQAAGQPRDVLIATQDIPARVPITLSMVQRQSRPSSALQPDAIGDPSHVVGSLALITIPAGSQVTSSEIGTNASQALPVRLRTGMRAMSISVDKIKGVSGLVQPGDRVDVIAVPRLGYASTILRGLRVLAIGTALESASATPSPEEQNATTVTLEVTPQQADLLATADINATLRLSLRSAKEPIRSQPVERINFMQTNSAPAPLATEQKTAPISDALAAGMLSMLKSGKSNASSEAARPSGPQSRESGRAPTRGRRAIQLIIGDQIYGSQPRSSNTEPLP